MIESFTKETISSVLTNVLKDNLFVIKFLPSIFNSLSDLINSPGYKYVISKEGVENLRNFCTMLVNVFNKVDMNQVKALVEIFGNDKKNDKGISDGDNKSSKSITGKSCL